MSARPQSRDAAILELTAEVRALRREIEELGRRLVRRAGLSKLELAALQALREVVRMERAFSAREVADHAQLSAGTELRTALAAAGVSSTRALGKLIRRAVNAGDLGGFAIERIGSDRLGAVWRICEFGSGNSQFVTPISAPDHRIHRIR